MALRLGQLIHTNFDEAGFSTLSSAEVPLSIQKAFIARIVYQYWTVRPQSSGYQAVYLHQVAPREVLFGWLYNDEAGGLGQGYAPYFVCYHWVGILKPRQLKALLACLQLGPVSLLDRHSLPDSIDAVVIPDPYRYQSARPGIVIPPEVIEQSDRLLAQGEELKLFVAIDLAVTVGKNTLTLPPLALSSAPSSSILQAIGRETEPKRFEQVEQPSSEQFDSEQFDSKQFDSEQFSEQFSVESADPRNLIEEAQQLLAQSSRSRVLSTLLLLTIAVSSFYLLYLFAEKLGGKLAPRELAPREKLVPREKLS